MTDLLPCPFCGSDAHLDQCNDVFGIICDSGSPCISSGLLIGFSFEDRERAIAAWNIRTPQVTVKPLVWVKMPEGMAWKYEAWCNLMQGYYYASTDEEKREHGAVRAARILAAITLTPTPIDASQTQDAAVKEDRRALLIAERQWWWSPEYPGQTKPVLVVWFREDPEDGLSGFDTEGDRDRFHAGERGPFFRRGPGNDYRQNFTSITGDDK